ncbi:MAG: HAD family hydrolase [Actinomycetota bacterium]
MFLDVGGVIYEDRWYSNALKQGLRELGAEFTDEEFAAEYDACRSAQSGSFRRRLTARFLGSEARVDEVVAHAAEHWAYPPEALHEDVIPCLEDLRAGYRLGVIANQQSAVREAMRRDGVDAFFDVWAISEDVGVEKPDPRLFAHAIEIAATAPQRTVMCGDRLDYDVEPARGAGMRAIWILRGEAPRDPTPEQLTRADASVRSLGELKTVLQDL